MFDNISFGHSRRNISVSIGEAGSYARYKRPAISKYSLESQNKSVFNNFSYSSDYKERFPSYSNREQRSSSYSFKREKDEHSKPQIQIRPTIQDDLIPSGLSKGYTYDTLQNDYNNKAECEIPAQTIEPKPQSRMKMCTDKPDTIIDKLKMVNQDSKNRSRDRSHQTISYDNVNAMPTPNKSLNLLSPQNIGISNLKSTSSGKLLDSIDRQMSSSLVNGQNL